MPRGQYTRTPEVLAAQRTPKRAYSQYLRTCDALVGRWLRTFKERLYNRILEKADAAAEPKTK